MNYFSSSPSLPHTHSLSTPLFAQALCWPGGNARETREGVALLERAAREYKDLRYEKNKNIKHKKHESTIAKGEKVLQVQEYRQYFVP